MEGWLRKKSHHIGLWKLRFFRLDGHTLRYWKHKRSALQCKAPRGELSLAQNCHVSEASSDIRFVIRVPTLAYDEELEAGSCEERDRWIYSLNVAALQHRRLPSGSEEAEDFLRAQGLWQLLEDAAAAYAAESREDVIVVEDLALRHVRFGGALLCLPGQAQEPRQGRLVQAGRHVRKGMFKCLDCQAHQELSASTANSEIWLLLMSSRVISECESSPHVLGVGSLLEEPREMPIAFEALHIFTEPLDGSGPIASLPLLDREVGEVARCKDGSGWSLRLQQVDEESGRCIPGGASWTITLETREEAEKWRQAACTACWAARARANGRRRAAEEALAAFDAGPTAWCQAMSRRLMEVDVHTQPRSCLSSRASSPRSGRLLIAGDGGISSLAGSSLPTPEAADKASEALRKVLAACEDVCTEAEGLLEAALSRRPLRQDAAGSALRCALVPALATAGRCWSCWNADLPHGEACVLLRWLEARSHVVRQLGLVCAPLDSSLFGLSSELSLRMGAHLRRLAEELLVAELGERLRQDSSNVASGPPERRGSTDSLCSFVSMGSSQAAGSTSTLPVDFFTFVNSCLLLDREVPCELQLCTSRVAKFVIREVQGSLWGWLLATVPEVPRDWRSRSGAATSALPTLLRRWFKGVTSLANAMPVFRAQCQDISANFRVETLDFASKDEDSFNSEPQKNSVLQPELGQEALPKEWSLEAEEQGFEAMLEAFLWAASDVATGRWRKQILTTFQGPPPDALAPLLAQHLDPCLQVLRNWLDPPLFERLLPKVFLVCMGSYVVKLSRGWLQGLGHRDLQHQRLSEEALCLCQYFGGLSLKPRGASEECLLWEPGRVVSVLHAVLVSQDLSRSVSRQQQPRQFGQRRAPLPTDWVGPLGFEDGLSRLVSVLTEGPLPLREVLPWFSDFGMPFEQEIEELPLPVPPGLLYLPPRSETRLSRSFMPTSPQRQGKRLSGASNSAPDQSYSSPGSEGPRRRLSGKGISSLFGQASTSKSRPMSQSPGEVAGNQALGLASEGAVCDLRVEQVGVYGAFCNIAAGHDKVKSAVRPDVLPNRGPRRRRWVQLAKASPSEVAVATFEVFASQPSDVQKASSTTSALLSLPLTDLKEVSATGATSLDLTFATSDKEGQAQPLRYLLDFDCPSHLFRVRLVLESWWAPRPIQEFCPVVVYNRSPTCMFSPEQDQDGWYGLSGPLTREVMERRLGGLWRDVRKRLEAA